MAPRGTLQTVIAKGVRVQGDFHGQGDILIDGEVHGNLSTSGVLTIGPQAVVTADVEAESAKVAGEVRGNMKITSHLDMLPTARVTGDVVCRTASIESGAFLKGSVSIGSEEVNSGSRADGVEKPEDEATVAE